MPETQPVEDRTGGTDGVGATDGDTRQTVDGQTIDGQTIDGQTIDGLRRELAQRTAEADALRAEVSALTGRLTEQDQQVLEWRAKAAEYDALMRTKTMHAVRIPRAIYGRILARTRK